MKKDFLTSAAILTALIATGTPAFAGSTSGAATVQGTIVASCTLTPPSIPSLTIDSIQGTGQTTSSNFLVQCTNGAPVTIGIDFGQHANGQSSRGMVDASGDLLPYNVYQDAAFGTVWGNSSGVNTETITGTGTTQSIPFFVKSAVTSLTPLGSYSDTVSITLSY